MNTPLDKEQIRQIFTAPKRAGKSTTAVVALFNELHGFTDKRIVDEVVPSGVEGKPR